MTLHRIQAIRGIAALLVVAFHASGLFTNVLSAKPMYGIFTFGKHGVDLFFVLSGFILTWVHYKHIGKPSYLLHYATKRAKRIYPMLWFASFLALFFYLAVDSFGKTEKTDPIAIMFSFLALPQQGVPLVNVSWTLQHEVLFYCLFAFFIYSKSIGIALFMTWQTLVILTVSFGIDLDHPYKFFLSPYSIQFGLGALSAYIVMKVDITHISYKSMAIAGTLLFLATGMWETYAGGNDFVVTLVVLYGFASMLLITGLAKMDISFKLHDSNRSRTLNFLSWLGAASYSLYLMHYSLVTILVKTIKKFGLLSVGIPIDIMFIVIVIISTTIGAAFYPLIEKPLMNLVNKTIHNKKQAPETN